MGLKEMGQASNKLGRNIYTGSRSCVPVAGLCITAVKQKKTSHNRVVVSCAEPMVCNTSDLIKIVI